MSLRVKVELVLFVIVGLVVGLTYGIQRFLILPGLDPLEVEVAQKDMDAAIETLNAQRALLDDRCSTWTTQSGLAQFVTNQNETYTDSYLEDIMRKDNLNLIYIVNTFGEVVWGEIIDPGTQETIELDEFSGTFVSGDDVKALLACGRESLRRGIAAMVTGRPLVDWARAVQTCVETECGFSLVRGLGGHGYGRKLHGPPFVSNVLPSYRGEWPDAFRTFEPGMLIAVEPILTSGSGKVVEDADGWTVRTQDGKPAVHYEHTILVTRDRPVLLTVA